VSLKWQQLSTSAKTQYQDLFRRITENAPAPIGLKNQAARAESAIYDIFMTDTAATPIRTSFSVCSDDLFLEKIYAST
jgi:hypothetical protein